MSMAVLALAAAAALALIPAPLFTIIAGLSLACLYSVDREWLALQVVLIELNRMASMPILVALPLFTFAGCLLTHTRAPQRVLALMEAVTGRFPGGLGIAALGACAFFTALTGASGVTIVALGGILFPILKSRLSSERFSLGLLTTAGSLGLLFPPSLPVILYGVVAQVEITALFRAALVPGILLLAGLSAYVVCHERLAGGNTRNTSGGTAGVSPRRVREAFVAGKWEWPLGVIVLGGIYGGVVTLTEVAALVAAYVLLIACVVLREVSLRRLPDIIVESAMLSGAVLVVLGMSLGLTGFLVDQQVPDRVLAQLSGLTDSRIVFLAGLNLFLLVVGCMMDIFSAMIIVAPIVVPVAAAYAVDPLHLGVIFLVNLEIGYSTPPVGMNLFIAGLKFERPVTALYRASLPYLAVLLLLLALITYVPAISLWLAG